MLRALIASICALFALGSCTQRTICPAYQSAFIYDKKKSIETFAYYNDDTLKAKEIELSNGKKVTLPARNKSIQYGANPTYADKTRRDRSDSSDREKYPDVYASAAPSQQQMMNKPYRSNYQVLPGPALPKERYVKYDRYLLLPRKTYKKAVRALNTVPMTKVYPEKPKPDSALVIAGAELDSGAMAATKKRVDSTYMITLAREKYNTEQENYLWYMRKDIILPDAWYARYGKDGSADDSRKNKTAAPAEQKKKKGFFKNLFKKKSKSTDSLAVESVAPQPTDSVQAKPKKKGFSLFKKKDKANKPKEEPQPKKDKKPADEDDGF